jgi:O-methyltransferase
MGQNRTFLSRAAGYAFRRFAPLDAFVPECGPEDLKLIQEVKSFTMTSPERIYGLLSAVRYLEANKLAGDIVECGVWKGGSMMAVEKALLALKSRERELYLYDTYAGMTAPTSKDSSRFEPKATQDAYDSMKGGDGTCKWCYSSIEETRRNVLSVGYPEAKVHFIKGPVEETIPKHAPETIALLRLDTDFYESSRHEMVHLFPRLIQGGVLLLDDYGHWEGQRVAVDEYLAQHKIPLLLNRLDYAGRIGVKLC